MIICTFIFRNYFINKLNKEQRNNLCIVLPKSRITMLCWIRLKGREKGAVVFGKITEQGMRVQWRGTNGSFGTFSDRLKKKLDFFFSRDIDLDDKSTNSRPTLRMGPAGSCTWTETDIKLFMEEYARYSEYQTIWKYEGHFLKNLRSTDLGHTPN